MEALRLRVKSLSTPETYYLEPDTWNLTPATWNLPALYTLQ
jgi:hypothetical protein